MKHVQFRLKSLDTNNTVNVLKSTRMNHDNWCLQDNYAIYPSLFMRIQNL